MQIQHLPNMRLSPSYTVSSYFPVWTNDTSKHLFTLTCPHQNLGVIPGSSFSQGSKTQCFYWLTMWCACVCVCVCVCLVAFYWLILIFRKWILEELHVLCFNFSFVLKDPQVSPQSCLFPPSLCCFQKAPVFFSFFKQLYWDIFHRPYIPPM